MMLMLININSGVHCYCITRFAITEVEIKCPLVYLAECISYLPCSLLFISIHVECV